MTCLDTVTKIQNDLFKDGWLWKEQVFSNGDVHIVFSRNRWCHALSIGANPNYNEDCPYGYGRFPRYDAWNMADKFLRLEDSSNKRSIERLRAYKKKWNSQAEADNY